MPCWPGASRHLYRWLATTLALLAVLVGTPTAASASDIEPVEARISIEDEDLTLSAEFAIALGNRLEDAIQRGIPLSFKMECLIERPRDYWVSEHITAYSQTYRLSYSSLTRQYRLAIGSLHQNFATLGDALRVLGRVNALTIAERSLLRPGTRYEAALRLSLDSSQLPKPFQLDALTSSAWKVDAKTRRWTFTTP